MNVTFRGGYVEDESGARWWSAELLAKVEQERDEARAEVDRLRIGIATSNESFAAGYTDGARDAYRRGADVMRDACAQWAADFCSAGKAAALRALPIPEPT